MSKVLLKLKQVSLLYEQNTVLSDIDLSIFAGQILTIMGANGSGKTSLLRVIVGIIRSYTGMIIRQPSLTLSYMPQKLEVNGFVPVQVKDFLLIGYGNEDEFFLELVSRMEIGPILFSQMSEISMGQLQRVFLVRCILSRAQLVVLDEPVSNMDLRSRKVLYDFIRFARDVLGCGVIITSHDLHCVMENTDRVVCMNKKIECSGSPVDVEDFVFKYLDPEVIPYHHRH